MNEPKPIPGTVPAWNPLWLALVLACSLLPAVLWRGELVYLSGGNYDVIIAAFWTTHLLIVFCAGHVLRKSGFGLMAAVSTIAPLGLAAGNIETLAWSVQWSAILSLLFFLVALIRHVGRPQPEAPLDNRERIWIAALSGASALCFSRGVLSGVACRARHSLHDHQTRFGIHRGISPSLTVLR